MSHFYTNDLAYRHHNCSTCSWNFRRISRLVRCTRSRWWCSGSCCTPCWASPPTCSARRRPCPEVGGTGGRGRRCRATQCWRWSSWTCQAKKEPPPGTEKTAAESNLHITSMMYLCTHLCCTYVHIYVWTYVHINIVPIYTSMCIYTRLCCTYVHIYVAKKVLYYFPCCIPQIRQPDMPLFIRNKAYPFYKNEPTSACFSLFSLIYVP